MRHPLSYVAALCAAVMMTACESREERRPSTPTGPLIVIQPPPPPIESFLVRDAPATLMTVGEVVEGRIMSSDPPCTLINNRWLIPCRHFLVTATKAGSLAATLTWDPIAWDMILLIRMGDRDFQSEGPPWSPLVARMKVDSGQQVRVMVGLAGTGEFRLNAPFSLTTSVEE